MHNSVLKNRQYFPDWNSVLWICSPCSMHKFDPWRSLICYLLGFFLFPMYDTRPGRIFWRVCISPQSKHFGQYHIYESPLFPFLTHFVAQVDLLENLRMCVTLLWPHDHTRFLNMVFVPIHKSAELQGGISQHISSLKKKKNIHTYRIYLQKLLEKRVSLSELSLFQWELTQIK